MDLLYGLCSILQAIRTANRALESSLTNIGRVFGSPGLPMFSLIISELTNCTAVVMPRTHNLPNFRLRTHNFANILTNFFRFAQKVDLGEDIREISDYRRMTGKWDMTLAE